MKQRPLKITAGLVVILALAYTGTSWYFGRQTQERIESWVEKINQRIAERWPSSETARPVLVIRDYQRGVFSSDIRYSLQFHDKQGDNKTVELRDALSHGPWPWAAVRQGEWRPAAAWSQIEPLPSDILQPWFGAIPEGALPWTLKSWIGFGGDIASQWQLAPIQFGNGRVDFSGGLVKFFFDPDTQRGIASARFDRLVSFDTDSGVRARFEGIELKANTTSRDASSLQSDQQLRLDRISVEVPDSPAIAFVGPVLKTISSSTGSLTDNQLDYDLGQIQYGDQDLGRINLGLSFDHLDMLALQALSSELERLEQTKNERPDDVGPSREQQQRLISRIKPVLAPSPRLSLDSLHWETSQGTSEIKFLLEFQPVADDVSQSAVEDVSRMLNEMIIKAIRQSSAQLRLSKPMLLQIVSQIGKGQGKGDIGVPLVSMLFDQFTGKLQREGLVQRQGDVVTADYRYAGQQFTVNGKPMSPVEFAAMLSPFVSLDLPDQQ